MFETINFIIGGLLSNPATAFFAGMLAIITPCTITIIPLIFFRFGVWQGKAKFKWLPIIQFLLAFLFSFLITGFVVDTLASSLLNNAFRMVLATGLIVLGVLGVFKKINLQANTTFTSPIPFGLLLPWIISVSPCVIPFITGLLAGAENGLLRFLFFGLGMILPTLLFAVMGKRFLLLAQKGQKGFVFLEKLAPALLITAGVLMLLSLVVITRVDLIVWFIITIVLCAALTIYRLLKNLTIYNLFLGLVSLSLSFVIGLITYSIIDPRFLPVAGKAYLLKCNSWYLGSPESVAVTTGVVTASLLISAAYLLSFKKSTKLKITLKW